MIIHIPYICIPAFALAAIQTFYNKNSLLSQKMNSYITCMTVVGVNLERKKNPSFSISTRSALYRDNVNLSGLLSVEEYLKTTRTFTGELVVEATKYDSGIRSLVMAGRTDAT
jgi:hypothetical protein